jgi:hypothetical protein
VKDDGYVPDVIMPPNKGFPGQKEEKKRQDFDEMFGN